ncbi:MAG: ATP-dependent RNA helicase RhlE [Patiriisocius sp.]
MTFKELNLHSTILESLDAVGFESPTPVQEQAIPIVIDNNDIIAVAQTGTGKTAAFLIPVLHKLLTEDHPQEGIKALVITPTRELAVQIDKEMEGFSYFTNCTSLAVYGGGDRRAFEAEKKAFTHGVDIIIATPGRMKSHMNLGYVNTKNLKFLILDEADRMLDMGFHDDILKIIEKLPKKRQNLLFSATMPPDIRKLAKAVMNEPKEINIAISKPAEGVLQLVYLVNDKHKVRLAESLLKEKDLKSVLIFASTKKNVDILARSLKKKGMNAAAIHSDLTQDEREETLRLFRARKINQLVATDIMARGIDIKEIDLVINYEVPSDASDYVHRVGRTARASATGIAITFVNENDMNNFHKIEQLIDTKIFKQKIPAEIGESPEWRVGYRKSGGSRKPNFKNKRSNNNRPKK